MSKPESDHITSESTASGQPYYRDGQHLRAKHQLAGNEFVRWALQRIPDWSGATILDAGGGWGRFIWPLVDDFGVERHDIILTDLSEGMLRTAREEAAQRGITIRRVVGSIQALPFPTQQFDIVMANHVLYHLTDIKQGARALARVLKPNGQLLATTNSDKIIAIIIALHYQALDTLGISYEPEEPSPFSMENGAATLATGFQRVESFYYEDEQLIHDAAEIRTAYETIGRYRNLRARDDISESAWRELPRVVERLAQAIIDRKGVLRSPILMGAFVGSHPIRPSSEH